MGVHGMSNTNIHNISTVTGNICYAVPPQIPAAPLTLNAELSVKSVDGERKVPITELFAGVRRRTTLKKNEIVTDIFVPQPDPRAVTVYY